MAGELTIKLDEDVAEMLEESRRAGRPADDAVRQAVNAAARRVLKELTPVLPETREPFVVRPFNMGKPLIDLECTARALDLLDELDLVVDGI